MEELNQENYGQTLLFSETKEKPFMSLFPSQKSLIWWSYPLIRDEMIPRGSKLFIKPVLTTRINKYGRKQDLHKRQIFIVSANE